MKEKRSFFERLTGAAHNEEAFEEEEERSVPTRSGMGHNSAGGRTARAGGRLGEARPEAHKHLKKHISAEEKEEWPEEEEADGQLSVDVFQTADDIIIKAMVAGVHPDDLDVDITQEMVTIKGKREESHDVEEDDFFFKELYWGSFSRTILLPQEVQVEEAEATEKNGLLTIRLPKVDKGRQTKLKVKSV